VTAAAREPDRAPAWSSPAAVVLAAFAVRAAAALLSDRVVADVLRYHKVASHVLDVSWNPYLAARLYPYPPFWIWVEAGAEWLARHAGLPFALTVKAPLALADALLAGLIATWAPGPPGGPARARWAPWAGWVYALHPVALLVVGFHGQFDSVALLALLGALRLLERGRRDRSALALCAGIALKSFPVLVLPFALLFVPGPRARVRYLVLALAPVALLLVPFAIADRAALARELFAYGGIPDFGWIGALRALDASVTGHVTRASASQWAALTTVSKAMALAAMAVLWWAVASTRLRWRLEASALGVLLAFEVFYGALSAQYLLWPIPLAVLAGERFVPLHAVAATAALAGFYVFLAPGVLSPADAPILPVAAAQRLWTAGTVLLWLVTAAWLADLVRRGRARS
jgi:hypothetical protein